MRPIRNRVARIAAIAALLVALSIMSSSAALGWGGAEQTILDGVLSVDDGGVLPPQ